MTQSPEPAWQMAPPAQVLPSQHTSNFWPQEQTPPDPQVASFSHRPLQQGSSMAPQGTHWGTTQLTQGA
jgi:hypothetical protein